MCSCDQCRWYDDNRANSSYKRPWVATNGQQPTPDAPLATYGLIRLEWTPGEGDMCVVRAYGKTVEGFIV